MRRILRWAFNGLAAVSAVLLVATCAIWVRSYFTGDEWIERSTIRYDADWAWTNERQIRVGLGGIGYEKWGALENAEVSRKIHALLAENHRPLAPTSDGLFHATIEPEYPYNFYCNGSHFGFLLRLGERPIHTFWVVIPLWFCALVLSVPSAVVSVRRRFRSRTRRLAGHCTTCGYDLRATPNRCPECGIDRPANPSRNRGVSLRR